MIYKHHRPGLGQTWRFNRAIYGKRRAFWMMFQPSLLTIAGCASVTFAVVLGHEFVGAWGWGIGVAVLGCFFIYGGAVSGY